MLHLTLPAIAQDLSLLLVRAIVGFAFLISARNKFRNVPKFAKQNGLPLPLARMVPVCELAGGAALIGGVLPQFAAAGLMLLMVNTMALHIFKWKSPYWASQGGWEYDLMLFALSSVVLIHGAGRLALNLL